MAYGFGKKRIGDATLAPVSRRGYYVPGLGTFERKVNAYENDMGERVIQSAGVLRHTDGSLHQAYAAQPGSYIEELLAKWRRGEPLNDAERRAIEEYLATNPTSGLPSVSQLGGSHNGGTGDNTSRGDIYHGGKVAIQNTEDLANWRAKHPNYGKK